MAVMVTLLVPGCVPPIPPLPLPPPPPKPPQATSSEVRAKAPMTIITRIALSTRLRAFEKTMPNRPGSRMANRGPPRMTDARCDVAERTGPVVAMVTVVPPDVLAKLQVAPVGRPEQSNETDWLKPAMGEMVNTAFPLCPGPETVMVAGLAAIWKSTTFREDAFEVDPL